MRKSLLLEWMEDMENACDPEAALRTAAQIARFHRIQATAGYHAAAECVSKILEDAGFTPQILSYAADLKTTWFTQKSFRQWECRSAWLRLTAPWQERAADFNLEEMSLIQRSAPADFRNQDVQILYVPDTMEPEELQEDVRGKLLFVKNGFERWNDFAMIHEAAGILTVSMPEIAPVRVAPWRDPQMCNSHGNLSFHHFSEESEKRLRGFALTPDFGERLEKACLDMAKEGRCPTARFWIDSSFQDGVLENVTAVIEGTTEEELLLTAHLCHPRSSVNDNASGAACAIETMCTLKRLVDMGKIPKPRRTIRMLLIPEFTGTYCWLWENREHLDHVVAGFNMDLVAGRMDGTAGPLIIVDTPDAAHACNGDVCEAILTNLQRDCSFGGPGRYVPMLFALRVPFALGSDHYILSDPTIDIPTVALTQWPDKTYHTSVDCVAHLDPGLMKKNVIWAGAYCLAYADFSLAVLQEVIPYTEKRLLGRITDLRHDESLTEEQRKEKSAYLEELISGTMERLPTLLPPEEREEGTRLVRQEAAELRQLLPAKSCRCVSDGPKPRRMFRAPLAVRCVKSAMTQEQKEVCKQLERNYGNAAAYMDQILYAADGTRTIEEIVSCIFCETGVPCREYIYALIEFLSTLGLVSKQ